MVHIDHRIQEILIPFNCRWASAIATTYISNDMNNIKDNMDINRNNINLNDVNRVRII